MSSSPSVIHVYGDVLDRLLHASGESPTQWNQPFEPSPFPFPNTHPCLDCLYPPLQHHTLQINQSSDSLPYSKTIFASGIDNVILFPTGKFALLPFLLKKRRV